MGKRLTHAYRVAVERQQLSMFLTKDGTLISIFSRDGSEVTPSIVARLRSRDTLLRTSEDASMLMQALIDVVVDKQLEITEAFRRKLDMLEGTALVAPQVATVRHLHVLSQQLSQHKRVVSPLQNLILSLRSFDEERTAFAAYASGGEKRDERREHPALRPGNGGAGGASMGSTKSAS